MNRTLTAEELRRYDTEGYLVIPDAVTPRRLLEVTAEAERMFNVAYTISEGTAMLDVDPAHTPENPRVRRIKSQHEHSNFFHAFAAEPSILDLLDPLMPSGIRVNNTKINMKSPHVGESVEWHQDWAFFPHTNDDALTVGIYLDDCTDENGPMFVVPGSHRGTVHDHHQDGYFCGAIDPGKIKAEIDRAVPLTGPAGTLTIHHVRLLHGSAHNRSDRPRRFLLHAYTAVDAWPLTDLKGGLQAFNDRIVRGVPTRQPRLETPPVRIPLPLRPDAIAGSIYSNQYELKNRFFDAPAP